MALHGERLDKPTYRVLQTLTEGNTAVCYKGYHDIFKQTIVQKTISLLGLDDALAYSEPELLKGLRHDHLVEVWEAQWDPDQPKILKAITFVMPWYEGGSVSDALAERHPFSLSDAVAIACGVLDALHYLHVERRTLHRDVKPGNVMLDRDRRYPYLGDLGSAAPMTPQGDAEARSGTLLYRPPEAHTGRFSVRGDIYGVGMLLHECLNGALPYAELDFNRVESRLAAGRPPVVARLLKPRPHVPPALARVVARMIDPDPSRRPPSAVHAQRALEDVKHMDWRYRGDGAAHVWIGRWPPAERAGQGRLTELRFDPISSGRYAGQVRLTARWRRVGSTEWRAFKALERRVLPTDEAALRGFFRAVEAAAKRAAAS